MLTSCYDGNNKASSIAEADKYTIYVTDNPVLYDTYFEFNSYDFSSEKRYTFPETLVGSDNSFVKSDIDDFELTLNNETEIFNYKYSFNSSGYHFETSPLNFFTHSELDTNVTVYADSNDIYSVNLGQKSFKITDSPITTEEELLYVCNSFLSQYTDLSSTQHEITTRFCTVEGEIIHREDKFATIDEYASSDIIEYIVDYNWVQNDYKRLYYSSIRVTNEGYLTRYRITKNLYSEMLSNAEIDYNKVNSIIEEKVKKLCENDAGYAFESIDYYEKGIYVIEGRLCAAVILSPFLSAPDKDYPVRGFPITLLITL